MNDDDMVAIKGIGEGLTISLSPTEEWLHITETLARRIDQQSAFFNGAKLTINLGERPVPKYELSGLRALLERRGLVIDLVISDSRTTIEAAQALDLRAEPLHPETVLADPEFAETMPISPEEAGTTGVLMRRTLRSGRTIRSDGHVIIMGDVNPGAEIIAAGDVFIWGRMRGNVHAGAYGDETAVVCALDMIPTQLRIAGYITTSPADKRRKPRPEVAMIRDGQIVVEAWDNNR
ncbi:MAG: septum site-determining protein MinC [Anaerolineaceae bacterium]|nr:MAG: septum site-determining protein MinC [Anaerolineaceae bacterium]